MQEKKSMMNKMSKIYKKIFNLIFFIKNILIENIKWKKKKRKHLVLHLHNPALPLHPLPTPAQ